MPGRPKPDDAQRGATTQPGYFLELFAGAGGLTAAIRRKGLPVRAAVDVLSTGLDVDLRVKSVYVGLLQAGKSGRIRCLHGGPPCRIFSRARRTDCWGSAPILRSDAHPQGIPGMVTRQVEEGNLLAARFAKIAKAVHRAGGWWSLENPARSFMWDYTPIKMLAKLPGAVFYNGDQCIFGGPYVKPTGWLTTAPFFSIVAQKCPGPPHHSHQPLQGRVRDHTGREVWLTSLAAEYPQGLCEVLADH